MVQHYNTKGAFILKGIIAFIFFNIVSQSVFGSGGITLSSPSGAPTVSAQTYVAGSTSNLIFGFGVTKASGSPDNITTFRINLNKDPNVLFPGASGITIKKNGSTISSTYAFGGSGPWFIDITLSSSQSVTPSLDQYRVFVDLNATVLSTDGPIVASLGNADVSFSAGGNTASGGAITGPSIAFSALTTTLATNNGGISSPLVGGATNTPIFGFSAASNGTQSVNNVVMTITTTESTLSNILTNIKLKDDGTNSSYSGSGTSYSASAPVSSGSGPFVYTITFTPSSPLSASAKYFYVVADVPGAAPATTNVQVDITTVGVDQGSTSTLTGFTETFNITPPSATVTQNNGGLATTLAGGTTNAPLFGFSATSNGSQTINNVVVKITTSASSLSSILTNIKLKDDGTNSTYSGGGTAYTAGAPVSSGSGPFVYTITFTPTSPLTSSSEYFYVVADIPGTAPSTSGIQFDVNTVGVDVGSVSSLTGFSRTFNITALTATLAQNNGSLSATIGAGSTNIPVFGFSAVSSGSQTLNNVVVTITTTASSLSSILTNIKLKDDGTNTTYSGGGTSYSAGAPVSSGSGPYTYTITFTPSTTLPVSPATSEYFYIVADVPGGASPTSGIQFSATTIGVNQGSTSSITGYNRTFDITLAQTSTITLNYVGQNSIDIGEYSDQTSSGLTVGNSQRVFAIDVTDADTDTQGTTITSLTLQFTGTAVTNLNAIALFDAGSSTKITNSEKTVSTAINGSNQIVFSGINIPVSDGSIGTPSVKTIDIRVTFNTAVVDNDKISISVAAATASASGSGLATIGSVATGSVNNPINVVATDLIFLDPADTPPYAVFRGPFNVTPSPNPGSTFSAKVAAVDANYNIDTDNNSSTTLFASGGTGSLSGGSGQSLVNGVKTFAALSINLAGTYNLGAGQGGLTTATSGNNRSIVVNVTSLGVNITAANLSNICYDGDFQSLSNIVIQESDPADFSSGSNQTFSLELPTGFIFNTAVTTAPTVTGNEISGASALTYSSDKTIVRFSYSISGTTNSTLDKITITGLQVKYTGSTAMTGDIVRIGGSALQNSNADTDAKSHGTLSTNANPFGDAVDFSVSALPGDPPVSPGKLNYSVSDKNVVLNGSLNSVAATGVFTGNGVASTSPYGYTFSPASAGQGSFQVVFTTRETANLHCLVSATKTFTISTANIIQNLQNSYCRNSPQQTGLTVTQSQIDAEFPPNLAAIPPLTYTLYDIVFTDHYDSVTINIFGLTLKYYVPSWSSIPTPNNIFKPYDNATYGARLNGAYDPGAIDFSFRVKDSNGVIHQSNATQRVPVHTPPTATFPMNQLSFCADDPPVDLTGNPLQTSNTANDFFTAIPSGSVAFTGGAWKFTPANAGAGSSPKTIDISYTFKDTGTGCSDTSSVVTVTVNPRPGMVPSANISPGVNIRTCQFGTLPSFVATPISGNYTWYSNSSLTSVVLPTGNIFNPNGTVSTGTPSTTPFYVTQTINGCQSLAGLPLSVTVDPQPLAPGSSFTKSYCLNSSIPSHDFSISSGTNIKWYSSTDNFVTPMTGISNTSDPTAAELAINTDSVHTYSFKISQTSAQSCESPRTDVFAVIKDLPALTITPSVLDLAKICVSGDVITFKTNRPTGLDTNTGTWSGSASGFLTNTVPGSTQLKPSSLAPKSSYTLRYDFTDQNSNCSNSTQVNISTFATILPSLSIGPSCNGFYTDIKNTSTVSPLAAATIDSIAWSFGDNSSLPKRKWTATIPNGFSDVTKGTFQNPSHKYKQIALVPITYAMTTSDGCTVTGSQQINIREVPKASFTWSNPCLDPSSNTSNVQFVAVNLNGNMPLSEIQSYTWNFATDGTLMYSSSATGKTPTVDYTSRGRDSVQLVLTSKYNCADTIRKPVFIVPSFPALTDANSYSQNFNSGSDGWIDGGAHSSWQYGTPAAPIINRDSSATGSGGAWKTNLTGNSNPKEQSWVLSPCFDFTQSLKPVISLDVWSETIKRLDGAVLEYNTSGNIENDASWNVVGQVGSGINWYDQTGISSKPGNQSAVDGDTGWTGDATGGKYTGWKHAIFKLDNLVGKSNVMFRIAFASNTGNSEGFAFDNVFIGERSRSVLLENFTNSSTEAGARTQNEAFNAFQSASSEVVKVQYHTAFPGYDTLNKANAAMNSARAAFYGLTKAPALRLDGNYGMGGNWFNDLYDQEILSPSPVKINVSTVKDGEVVKINASVSNITTDVLSTKDTHLFVVVVEKSITTAPWLGNDGDVQFKYVARQMLPSPAGIPLPDNLGAGQTFQSPELIWQANDLTKPNNSGIVVFVQGINRSKQVLQAEYLDNGSVEPDVITGIEPSLSEQIRLYPNPADQSVTLHLASPVHEEAPLKMFDINGNEVYQGIMEKGQQVKVITTENLTSGVYLLQLNSGSVVRRKVMILHP